MSNGSEAILYAVAECFEQAWSDEEDNEKEAADGFCLARDLLYLSPHESSTGKAQGFLFNLLVMATGAAGSSDGLKLASNTSSEGLVGGLLHVLQDFYNTQLDGREYVNIWDMDARLPISVRLAPEVTQCIASAYCALRILTELSKDEQAIVLIFNQKGLIPFIRVYLLHSGLHPVFVLSVLNMTYNIILALGENKVRGNVRPVLEGLLTVLERSTTSRPTSNRNVDSASDIAPSHNLVISEKALRTLFILSLNWEVDEAILPTYLDILAKLLSRPNAVSSMDTLAEVACNLATLHPSATAAHDGFVHGIIQILHTGQNIDLAVECLKVMHAAKSLGSYSERVQTLCKWHMLSEEHVHSLVDVFSDLFADSTLATGNHDKVISADGK